MHDFGLVGFLDRNTRRHLAAFMQAFVLQDAEWLLDAALDLGLLARGADRAEFSGRLEELLQDYVQLPLREWSFAEALLRITRMSEGQQVRMPRNLLVLTRTLFLMESTVRTLGPGFDLMDGLLGKGAVALNDASDGGGENDGGMTRLKYEMAIALRQIPEQLASLLRKARAGQIGIQLDHRGLETLQANIERASSRMALSMVALGLCIAASLLMQHSIGPQLFGFPVLAALGYALAGWLTVRVVKGVGGK